MTRVLLAAACLFCVSASRAQSPSGYLGKRTTLELGADYGVLGLIDLGQPERTTAGVGLSATAAYVVGRRLTLGAYARVQPLRSVARATAFGAEVAVAEREFTAVTLAAELAWAGGKPGRIAPVGLHWTVGLGYTLLPAAPVALTGEGTREELQAGLSRFRRAGEASGGVSVSLGAGYRYVYGDRVTVVPFLRADLATLALGGPFAVPVGLLLQTGVRVGGIF